jgi:MULE transposase domain
MKKTLKMFPFAIPKRLMIMDKLPTYYALFDDMITFDTTFSTNKEYRSFGVFVGFNHFREFVVFGASLLNDESVEFFEWLFETFLEAQTNK